MAIQLIGSHPVLTQAVNEVLSRLADLSVQYLPPALNEAEANGSSSSPRLCGTARGLAGGTASCYPQRLGRTVLGASGGLSSLHQAGQSAAECAAFTWSFSDGARDTSASTLDAETDE